jgi:signal recognition particle subunit SRP54
VQKGKGFDLEDFRGQMEQMMKMGGIASLLDKMPGFNVAAGALKDQAADREVRRLIAIINSMTPQERGLPDIIKGSRKRRIATGSGTQIQDVNRLLKQFDQAQRMMKKMKGGGMMKMLRGLQGKLPPGALPPFKP